MATLATLSQGFTALVILDRQGIVQYSSSNLPQILEVEVTRGQPLPAILRDWQAKTPWEAEIGQRKISMAAEDWNGQTILLVSDRHSVYNEASIILNSINEGIHVVNGRGQTVFYNPTMAKMEGLDYNQVINKDVLAMFPSLTPESSTILRVLRTREPIYDLVQTYYNHNGQRIISLNSTIPLWQGSSFIGVLEVARDVTRMENLARKVVELQQKLYRRQQGQAQQPTQYTFADIIGDSPALRRIIQVAQRAATTPSPVLIYGETGTGKELVAQSIHGASPRSRGPFIAQNCAALPGSLLEGILFGTVKGSFTGAVDRPGLIEQADGGTLLLDEINSMDIDLQAKLLRVFQDNRVRRLGGVKEVSVDVRIIATTNTRPLIAVEQGSIRRDLYYRLAVVNIVLPPLRERREDIPQLSQHFVDKYNQRFALSVKGVSPEVMASFQTHSWPGNVRELEHIIEGAMNIMGDEGWIDLHHLPRTAPVQGLSLPEIEHLTLPLALSQIEAVMIAGAMERAQGNISQAARQLGITRQALQYKLKKYASTFPD